MSVRIPDSHVEHAISILTSGAHATARAAYDFAEKQLKVTLARAEVSSDGKTVSDRQNHALLSDEYARALNDFRLIAEAYYKERDRREASVSIIEAWRTQQSDNRATGKVG